jgi:hypothetical protein
MWRRAAALLEELGHRKAAEVRARLDGDPEADRQERDGT